MDVNVKQIYGNWDLGYSLDKHKIRSIFKGHNEFGHKVFDTLRTPAGEAVYQLKYNKRDILQVPLIVEALKANISPSFSSASFIMPMPPSKTRRVQPVYEIAKKLASSMGISYIDNLVVKNDSKSQVKDIVDINEKVQEMSGIFSVQDILNEGKFDMIIVDDLHDTGTSLKTLTTALRGYSKIGKIFVATVTRT